jgi:hypothetical protein
MFQLLFLFTIIAQHPLKLRGTLNPQVRHKAMLASPRSETWKRNSPAYEAEGVDAGGAGEPRSKNSSAE